MAFELTPWRPFRELTTLRDEMGLFDRISSIFCCGAFEHSTCDSDVIIIENEHSKRLKSSVNLPCKKHADTILIQLAVSISRQYHADERGAKLAGNPLYLAGFLAKLDAWVKRIPMGVHRFTAHMSILNSLKRDRVLSLFSTQPIGERGKRWRLWQGVKEPGRENPIEALV